MYVGKYPQAAGHKKRGQTFRNALAVYAAQWLLCKKKGAPKHSLIIWLRK